MTFRTGMAALSVVVAPGCAGAPRKPGDVLRSEPVAVSAMLVVGWMADRFAGKPAPDECVKPR
jgi:hypothetical protein